MSTPNALEPGTILGGEFEVVRPLRGGSMGAVYVARQHSTGALRALKVMHLPLTRDPKLRTRFEQEARVSTHIASDHVIQVIAAGIDDWLDLPWLALELLDGSDLASVIREHGAANPVTVREVVGQLAHALSAAHRANIVHRDLKPENIFMATARREGVPFTVKVLDFGIAKFCTETATEVTDAVGTPIWMSPEQSRAGRAIGPHTDIWALGLIVFNLLTGKVFWRAAYGQRPGMPNLLDEMFAAPLPRATERARELGIELPPEFDDWMAQCIARDASKRIATVEDAKQWLFEILDRTPVRILESKLKVSADSEVTAFATWGNTAPSMDRPAPTPSSQNHPPPVLSTNLPPGHVPAPLPGILRGSDRETSRERTESPSALETQPTTIYQVDVRHLDPLPRPQRPKAVRRRDRLLVLVIIAAGVTTVFAAAGIAFLTLSSPPNTIPSNPHPSAVPPVATQER